MDNEQDTTQEHHHLEEAIRLLLKGLLPVILVIGGITLLFLRLSGWSLVLGLPMTVIGSVFLIYTYDEVVQKRVEPVRGRITKCMICHKVTPMIPGVDKHKTICLKCEQEGR